MGFPEELNERFRGEMYILTSAKDHNHFMDAESTIQMWEGPLLDAFSKRRHELGLTRETRGALVYDAFMANESTSGGTTVRRDLWGAQPCPRPLPLLLPCLCLAAAAAPMAPSTLPGHRSFPPSQIQAPVA